MGALPCTTLQAFAEAFLRVPEAGTRRLVPMRLHAEQRRLFAAYDAVTPGTGLPQYAELMASWIKKSGKTTTAAAVSLYDLLVNPYEPEAREIIIAGADLDQGVDAVLAQIKRFIRHHEWLRRHLRVLASEVIYREQVREARTGGEYTTEHRIRVIASRDPKSAHGHNASLVICDEWWAASPDLAEALAPSAARRAARMLYTTYCGLRASQVAGNPLWDLFTRWKAGEPGLFVSYIGGPDGWRQIPWITERFINQERRRLAHIPSRFRRLWQNEWSAGDEGTFLSSDEIQAAIDRHLVEPVGGETGVGYSMGVDLGYSWDWAAVTVAHADPATTQLVVDAVRFWRGTKAAPIDLMRVQEEILALGRRFTLQKVLLDQWQGLLLKENLIRLGLSCVEAVTLETARLDAMATLLKNLFASRRIRIPAHPPELIEQLETIRGEESARRDRIRFTSGTGPGAGSHDDIVVSLVLAAQALGRDVGRPNLPARWARCEAPTIGFSGACYLMGGQVMPLGGVWEAGCRLCPGHLAAKRTYAAFIERGGQPMGLRAFAQTMMGGNEFTEGVRLRLISDRIFGL